LRSKQAARPRKPTPCIMNAVAAVNADSQVIRSEESPSPQI
jgi:hypothetical protein